MRHDADYRFVAYDVETDGEAYSRPVPRANLPKALEALNLAKSDLGTFAAIPLDEGQVRSLARALGWELSNDWQCRESFLEPIAAEAAHPDARAHS